MTRTRLVLCLALIGAMGACGGRSGLRVSTHDGGGVGDGSGDGRFDGGGQDGRFEGGLASETGADVVASDARADVVASDAKADVAASDVRADVVASDSRIEGGTSDVRAEAGGLDGVRDAPVMTDAIRPDVSPPPRDASPDAPPTLSSIEISPASPRVNVGIPLSVVITAVYSDGSTKDVSSSSAVTSGATAILTVVTGTTTLNGVKAGTATITATYQGKTATATVTVIDTSLQSISIGSVAPISIGGTVNLVATGVFADGSKQDVTSQATWSLSSAAIATVGNTGTTKGLVTGVAVGTATVTATVQAISGKVDVSVVAKKITSVGITPTQPILQRGVTQAFKATAVYDDNSTGDVTQQATWSTGDSSVLTVVATGADAGRATAQAAGTTTLRATLGGINGTTSVTVTAPPLTSIMVSPATATIMVGGTRSFTAQGAYADRSTADLTDSVTWSSSDTTILSVSNATGTRGQAAGKAVGTANVQASLSGVTGTAAVTVSAAPLVSIAVTPNPLNLPLGLTLPLKATATYGDATTTITQDLTTTATWTVADGSVATVGNAGTAAGQVTGKAIGTTTVTATLSGISGTATVNVANPALGSITVAPVTATVTAGTKQPFTATGNYDNSTTADLTTLATWSSSNTAVAEVSNAAGSNGVATTLVGGTATITATFSGVQGTATLTVTAPVLVAIMVTPATATITARDTQTYTVRGVYANGTTGNITGVNWSSSSTAVATIVAGGGGGGGGGAGRATATGVAAGTTTITATYVTDGGASFSDTATLTVTAPPPVKTPIAIRLTPTSGTIQVNENQPYTVNVDYSDGSTAPVAGGVTLTTSDGTVAAVAGGGRGGGGMLVNGVGAGTATITATYTTGGQTFTDTATLTVTSTPPPSQVGLYITPASASVEVNGTQQFQAHATFSDGTETLVTGAAQWTTSNGTLATVGTGGGRGGGGAGLATGLAAGTVTINASSGGFSATATLAVTSTPPPTQVGLYITPPSASVKVNDTYQFRAFATYSNGTATDVTNNTDCAWGTSDPTLATVTNAGAATGRGGVFGGGAGGLARGLAAGAVTVNASFGGFSDTATLTVDPLAVLKRLVIAPATATIQVNLTQTFTATAVYDDGTAAPVTGTATWNSSNPAIAVMSVGGGGRGGGPGPVVGGGTATALAVGSATISATYTENGVTVTGTAVLTVTDPPLLSLEITPTNPTVSLLSPNQPFVATAIYTDYTTRTVTTLADWSSSNPTVAVISTSGGTTGRATGLAAGTTTITAAYGGRSASTTLTVVSKKVTTIQVTPTNPTAHLGLNLGLVATAIYDDSSTGPVTGAATWTSSDATVATVGTTGGSAGVATPIKAGTTTITAAYQGVSGTTVLTVSGAALSSIAITPSPLSVAVGGHQQLTATGTWADATTADITNNVTWLSSSDAIATVSNAAGSRGLFTAVSAGPVTVTAAFQSKTGTLAGTVTASH